MGISEFHPYVCCTISYVHRPLYEFFESVRLLPTKIFDGFLLPTKIFAEMLSNRALYLKRKNVYRLTNA